ncbi:hypothetical protein KI387_027916, partial [Taxus chinensis]
TGIRREWKDWRAGDIALKMERCSWMSECFMGVNTSLGAERAFITSLYKQYAHGGCRFR